MKWEIGHPPRLLEGDCGWLGRTGGCSGDTHPCPTAFLWKWKCTREGLSSGIFTVCNVLDAKQSEHVLYRWPSSLIPALHNGKMHYVMSFVHLCLGSDSSDNKLLQI